MSSLCRIVYKSLSIYALLLSMLPCFGKMVQLGYFEQLFPVGGGVHGYEYVRQAVYDFHVAARRYPYQG